MNSQGDCGEADIQYSQLGVFPFAFYVAVNVGGFPCSSMSMLGDPCQNVHSAHRKKGMQWPKLRIVPVTATQTAHCCNISRSQTPNPFAAQGVQSQAESMKAQGGQRLLWRFLLCWLGFSFIFSQLLLGTSILNDWYFGKAWNHWSIFFPLLGTAVASLQFARCLIGLFFWRRMMYSRRKNPRARQPIFPAWALHARTDLSDLRFLLDLLLAFASSMTCFPCLLLSWKWKLIENW